MGKWVNKILMMVVVATILGHNSMPHHHYMDIHKVAHNNHHHSNGNHHHDHDHEQKSKDHNIFSFAQLDEDFLPKQFSKITIVLPLIYLLTPVISFKIQQLKENSKTHYGYYREFPPPDKYESHLFSRPPPTTC